MLETRIRVAFMHNGKEIEGDLIKVVSVSDSRVGLVGVISVEGENLMIRKLTELKEVREQKPDVPDISHWGGDVRSVPCSDQKPPEHPNFPCKKVVIPYRESANHHGQRACEAYQASDQMVCDLCDLVWDVNDPEPPHCQRLTRIDPIMA